MNLEKQNKSDDDIKKNKFTANNRYFTICIYTMFVIFFGAIIINLITSWNTTLKNIEKGLTVLMPFIIGALIAYILNPAVARFYKLFRDKCKIKSDALCKILAIITAYVLVIGIIVIVLFGVIPQIITSLTDLVTGMNIMLIDTPKIFIHNFNVPVHTVSPLSAISKEKAMKNIRSIWKI